jgi:hypothetical protein
VALDRFRAASGRDLRRPASQFRDELFEPGLPAPEVVSPLDAARE